MGEKQNDDVANEPVDYDDGIIDTGVLHEVRKCDDPDCKLGHPHPESPS